MSQVTIRVGAKETILHGRAARLAALIATLEEAIKGLPAHSTFAVAFEDGETFSVRMSAPSATAGDKPAPSALRKRAPVPKPEPTASESPAPPPARKPHRVMPLRRPAAT